MFCRNCGKKLDDSAEICTGCGCKPNVGKNYCQNCGEATTKEQEMCIKCGVKLTTESPVKDFTNSLLEGDGSENYDFSKLSPYYQKEFKLMKNDSNYKGKFNWAAFFFGPLWLLSKSVIVPAIIYLVVEAVLTYVYNPIIGILSIITVLLFGLRGNFIYYNYYTKKKIRIF